MACSKADAEKGLRAAFNEVDTDHSGSIDAKEVTAILTKFYQEKKKPCDPAKIQKDVQSFLADVDKNHDGKVSLDEFLGYFMQFFK